MSPTILCLCLAGPRADFLKRSVQCFKDQTYPNKKLLIWDPGFKHVDYGAENIIHATPAEKPSTVGALRNAALEFARSEEFDYVAHWDYDDWSAPCRLLVQLAHSLKTSRYVTGFSDMTMYDTQRDCVWQYTNAALSYALGTSLFYHRDAWREVQFPDKTPEDNVWRKLIDGHMGMSRSSLLEDGSPIMIQTVHGGNASARIVPSSRRFKEASEAQAQAVRAIFQS